MAHHQRIYKKPEVDLRLKYRRILEASLIVSLTLLIILLYSFKSFNNKVKVEKISDTDIILMNIPQTTQESPPPPAPIRPSYFAVADGENIPDEIPIDELNSLFDPPSDPLPPPVVDDIPVKFYELSEKPIEIHRVVPVYPEMAKKVNIQGMVVVQVLINTKGDVEDVRVIKSNPMLDEAAITAARQFKFTPAKQRDRLVKVWMSIPFHFRLKN
jgi:protein TonB